MALDSYLHFHRPPAPGRPLIFAFHGTGGDQHQFTGLIDALVPGAGVVAPLGDVFEGGAARFFRRTGEGVYDMADLDDRAGRLADFVAAAQEAHSGGAESWALGYSNGANILAAMLMRRPGLFRRAALLHPLIPWAPDPVPGLSDLPVLVTAGRHDPICPWPLTERFVAWLRAQGAAVQLDAHEGGHEMRQAELEALSRFLS